MEGNDLPPLLKNNSYPKVIKLRLFAGLFLLSIFIVGGLIVLPNLFGYLLIVSIGIAVLLIPLIYVFILKPQYIDIMENGISFIYIWKRNRFVKWEEVKYFNLNKGDLSTYFGSDRRCGVLIDLKWHYYPMNYEVASEIYKAYVEKVGKVPPHDTNGVTGLP
jgi:hypothetical protein